MYSPGYAQKEKRNENTHEVIIIKNGDKEKKYTIETKNGEVFINGKPSSEYKGEDLSVITEKGIRRGFEDSNFNMFKNWDGAKKTFLGVTTESVNDGVKITDVSKNSPAEKAGLKAGDIITKLGNKNISNPEELMEAVTAFKPRQEVTIFYKRDGKTRDVKTTLGERSMSRSFSFTNNDGDGRNFNFKMPEIAPFSPQPFVMGWDNGHRRLGIKIEDTDNEMGVKIINVDNGSAAAEAGLKENDIITEVNGKKVKDVNEARDQLNDVKDKSAYNIKAQRNGSDMTFEVKIPKRKNSANL